MLQPLGTAPSTSNRPIALPDAEPVPTLIVDMELDRHARLPQR